MNPRLFGAYLSTVKYAAAPADTPGAMMSERPMTEYDHAQVNARLNGGQVRQDIALQGAPAAPQPAAPAAAPSLGRRMFNNAASLFTPFPAMLGRAVAKQRSSSGAGVGQFSGNPAPTPQPAPPPRVGQFSGNPRPTPAPTPTDTPGAKFGPGPKVKSSYINPRIFGAYLSTVKNGGLPTSNRMRDLTRNIVATGLGNAVNQLANPQSALHQGLKNLGTNPGVFSAAGAAALHPSISDEALQHGGYKAPAPGVTFRPNKATLNSFDTIGSRLIAPSGALGSNLMDAARQGARNLEEGGNRHYPGPAIKSGSVNPRIFGAMLAQLR